LYRIPRVKICGIATLEDALLAVDGGADALGFLVGLDYNSVDQLEPETARELVRQVPLFVNTVLVTHRRDPQDVLQLCRAVAPSSLQLHGGFPEEGIGVLRNQFPHLKIFEAVHVVDLQSVEYARALQSRNDGIVLDTRIGVRLGGTGQTHDWSISRRICEAQGERRVILAGGLSPENVVEAIRTVQPWGVDVNTGVSAPDGRRKSPDHLAKFIDLSKREKIPSGDPRVL
jgi:phosphoribosylanthranilate isomerase